jgi:formylglycine-generating enzyme required for sulfatase activity
LWQAIGQFAGRVGGADVAMVYFAGHGATFGDTPYVVPVDAEFASIEQAPYGLVPVETLIGELRRAKGVRIAILDACRDNAAERELKRQVAARGGTATRGLGPMKNPDGLILAYATQYLSTAADSAGSANSPFTAALLHNIATPGLDVKDLFYTVGQEVLEATGGKQRPEISVSIYERYALVPSPGAAAAPLAGAGPHGAGAPPAGTAPSGSGPGTEAALVWRDIQATTSLAVLDEFIRHYGNAPVYGALARSRRDQIAAAAVTPPPTPPPAPLRPDTPLTAAQERGLKPKDTFRECENCPEMVVVPAGAFTMGSPDSESQRDSDEGPQHTVTIPRPFAAGKLHVTVDQFAAFVRETGYSASTKCYKFASTKTSGGSWRDPGFVQEGSHPVVCINWDDAKAYVAWLAKKTDKPYRLLSEAEFEYAARGRTSPGAYPRFWFGNDESDICRNGNGADQKARDSIPEAKNWTVAPCNDGYAYTSPAGHYTANAFGLYDMAGNAWQWLEDCWHSDYNGAPADGSPWTTTCSGSGRVVRGGSWYYSPWSLRAARRVRDTVEDSGIGVRVARTLKP